MFSVALLTLGLAASALAGPYKRGDSPLVVSLSHPASFSSVSELTVTASVKNTGAKDVKVLKYGSVLDDLAPTKGFEVTKDGKEVAFKGIKLSLSLTDMTDKEFVVIPAGKTVEVTHKLADRFDFAAAGSGKFTFAPRTTFSVTYPNERVSNPSDLTHVEATGSNADIEIKGDVKNVELAGHEHAKRASDTCTNSSQKSFIDASYSEGKSLAAIASQYISSNGANSLYTSYYKSTSTSNTIAVFNRVSGENSGSRTLNCSDPYNVCGNGVIAYTVTSTTNIYFCSIFYNEVTTSKLCSGTSVASRNIRGGTVLHEITHATSGTTDVGYGCSYDQGLSASQAASNADNYNCFATQVYASTRC